MSFGGVHLKNPYGGIVQASVEWYKEEHLAQYIPTLQAEKNLGGGNFGTVLQVNCHGKRWAVKQTIDPGEADLIKREAAVLRSLNLKEKPNQEYVVQAIALVLLKRNPMLVMKLYEGGDLLTRVSKMQNGLALESTIAIAKQLLGALAFLKEERVIHRDLKLANIFYEEGDAVKLGDFGFSMYEEEEKQRSILCGTPQAMSPELLEAHTNKHRIYPYGSSSDMWALGCLLFEIFSGSHLFLGQEELDWMKTLQSQQEMLSDRLEPLLYGVSEKKYLKNSIDLSLFNNALKKMLELNPVKRLTPEHGMIVLSGQEPFTMIEKEDIPLEENRENEADALERVQDTQEERGSFVWIEKEEEDFEPNPTQDNNTVIHVIFNFFELIAGGVSRWLRG